MIGKLFAIALLATLSFGLIGCNTMEGVGRDVEVTGETVQEWAR